MDSIALVVASSLILIALLSAVIFLALLHTKTETRQLQFLMHLQEQSSKQTQEAMTFLRDTLTDSLETTSSLVSASQQVLAQATTQQISAQQKMVEATTFGASSSVETLAKLVRETTTFLATKEPLAYQMAMGAQSAPFTSGSEQDPYTSTDAQAQADAAKRAADAKGVEEALGYMSRFVGGSPDVTDYTVAGQ